MSTLYKNQNSQRIQVLRNISRKFTLCHNLTIIIYITSIVSFCDKKPPKNKQNKRKQKQKKKIKKNQKSCPLKL